MPGQRPTRWSPRCRACCLPSSPPIARRCCWPMRAPAWWARRMPAGKGRSAASHPFDDHRDGGARGAPRGHHRRHRAVHRSGGRTRSTTGFRERFLADAAWDARHFLAGQPGHWRFDLAGYVAGRLEFPVGIRMVEALGKHDTYAEEESYFSFRRATHRGQAVDAANLADRPSPGFLNWGLIVSEKMRLAGWAFASIRPPMSAFVPVLAVTMSGAGGYQAKIFSIDLGSFPGIRTRTGRAGQGQPWHMRQAHRLRRQRPGRRASA